MKTIEDIYRYLSVLVLLCLFSPLKAQQVANDSIDTESDDFVTVSFLIGSPLEAIYSVFGHGTLRMQCPAYDLDFVFTFESDTDVSGFMTGVAGKAEAKYVAVPTSTYIEDSKLLGRELKQYKLNLTLDERKHLWQLLDEEMMAGAYKHFNLLYDNCLSTSVRLMEQSLIDERLEWGEEKFPMTMDDGDFFRYTMRHSPWSEFVFITFIGTAYDGHSSIAQKISPENIISTLRDARFINDQTGESRPVVTDEGTLILKGQDMNPAIRFTPVAFFAALLVLTLLITALQWWLRWDKMGNIYDILLFTAQALVGLLIIYIAVGSELFASTWNWYIIPFFPVPLLLMFFMRGKSIERKAWMTYSAILALFILLTPFLGALDLPHQLITGSLLTRSLNRYLKLKKNII